MNYKIIQENSRSFKATLLSTGEEIGVIEFSNINNYIQINMFGVKEKYRRQGIGKALIFTVVEYFKYYDVNAKIDRLIVYPKPYVVYEGDNLIEYDDLIKVYESLEFTDCSTSKRYKKMERLIYT